LIGYHLSIATFIVFLMGCGWSESIVSFLILRFIAGCAASSPSTIGGGTVADVIPVHERGAAMAVTAIGPILAPVIGPVVGGFVAQHLGWRWTFWLVGFCRTHPFSLRGVDLIVKKSSIWLLVAMIFMQETYAPLLLNEKLLDFER